MEHSGEENIGDLRFGEKSVEKYKQDILDKNYKIAASSFKRKEKKSTLKGKKPFFKIGIILFILSIIFLVIILKLPWMYISYNPSLSDVDHYENFYYRNMYTKNNSYNNTVENFFNSENSTRLLGINSYDFQMTPKSSIYIFGILGLLGFLFTIFVILDNKKDFFSIQKLYIFHSLFMGIIMLVSTYLIYLSIKFFSAILLSFINKDILYSHFSGLYILFPVPLLIIFISAILMKLSGTLIKSDYKELIKFNEEKESGKFRPNRSY